MAPKFDKQPFMIGVDTQIKHEQLIQHPKHRTDLKFIKNLSL